MQQHETDKKRTAPGSSPKRFCPRTCAQERLQDYYITFARKRKPQFYRGGGAFDMSIWVLGLITIGIGWLVGRLFLAGTNH